jgi:Tfp pilus assembly protein PilF
MGQDDFERIHPADLDISATRTPAPAAQSSRSTHFALLALVALCIVAVLVVVLLPRILSPAIKSPAPGAPSASAPAATSNPGAATASGGTPWEQAQQERERSAAKSALDELLAVQFELQERGADKWAAQEFAKATALARAGDEQYRAARYRDAETQYRSGTQQFQQLRDGIPKLLEARLSAADAALNNGDATTAQRLFAEALVIDPSNATALKGAQRAARIDTVLALMSQAASAETAGNSTEATRLYQEALALDGDFTPARSALSALQQKESGKRYAGWVSSGYAALAAGDLQRARSAFQDALKIRPAAKEARDGLQQANFQLSQGGIARSLKNAETAVAAERWQDAVDAYAAALAIDASLSSAAQGKRTAEARAALDAALARIASDPRSLATPKTMDTAQRVLAEADAINPAGPRLKAQTAAAREAINLWRTKVPVIVRSDGSTDVTIFRVGNLGRFEQKSVELMPGRYVAVGQRGGYRDVRVEFSVDPGQSNASVSVQCRERI